MSPRYGSLCIYIYCIDTRILAVWNQCTVCRSVGAGWGSYRFCRLRPVLWNMECPYLLSRDGGRGQILENQPGNKPCRFLGRNTYVCFHHTFESESLLQHLFYSRVVLLDANPDASRTQRPSKANYLRGWCPKNGSGDPFILTASLLLTLYACSVGPNKTANNNCFRVKMVSGSNVSGWLFFAYQSFSADMARFLSFFVLGVWTM